MAHGLSEGEPLRRHTTTHRGAAPKHNHIFFRLINSDSGTLSTDGKFIPSLARVSESDNRLHNQIGSQAHGFIPDWLRLRQSRLFLTSFQLLDREIKGIRGNFSLTSSSNMNDGLTLNWADVLNNHSTLLRIDWQDFRPTWNTWLLGYQATTWWVYIFCSKTLISLLLILFSASNAVTMIFQAYIEEWSSI